MKSTENDGGGNELSLGAISGVVGGSIVIIIIGGGMLLLVIFLFKKKIRTKSVGTYTSNAKYGSTVYNIIKVALVI